MMLNDRRYAVREVQPYDPTILMGVLATLATVSLAASYIPARLATRIDPAISCARSKRTVGRNCAAGLRFSAHILRIRTRF